MRFNLMSLRFCLSNRIPFCPVMIGRRIFGIYLRSHRGVILLAPDAGDDVFRHELAHHFHACQLWPDFRRSPHGSYFMAAEIIVGQFFSGNKQGGENGG
jgi:hypothetical protein